tara:strand:- start:2065 stop:3510 length:1446 start_codon:yes stop_codon:yes gene_type:complete
MRNPFILVFVFALAAAGTNAHSVSGVQAYRPPQFEHTALCKRGYNMQALDKETMQAMVAFFYKNQTYLTDFGCRLVSSMLCKLADGEVRMKPKQECFNPRGENTPIAPSFHPLMFDVPMIVEHGSAIQTASKKMENMNQFHLYQTPTTLFIGDKTVRVFKSVSAILFECVEVRSLVYVHNNDVPMPEGAVKLEVHEEGMCMSPKAVNTIVNESLATGDAPLDLYMNKYVYDGCFGPHIEKYLRSKEITRFVNMSKSGNSNRTSMIETWVEALNAFSKISDSYTDSTVYNVVKAIMEKAAIESGVCVDSKMDTKEIDRLKWLIESDPNTWGEGFSEILTFFLCDSEGLDVNRFDDPASIIEKIFRALAESQTNWVKFMYFSSVCGNLNKVGLVLVIAGVVFWSVRKWFRGGRVSSPNFKQKQRNLVRKRQRSWASFKQKLLKDVWQKFAACCSCLKPTKTTKTEATRRKLEEASFEDWDPWQ